MMHLVRYFLLLVNKILALLQWTVSQHNLHLLHIFPNTLNYSFGAADCQTKPATCCVYSIYQLLQVITTRL